MTPTTPEQCAGLLAQYRVLCDVIQGEKITGDELKSARKKLESAAGAASPLVVGRLTARVASQQRWRRQA